jgi:hypothetical protein
MAFVLGSHGHGHESVHQAGEKAYVMEVPRLASALTFTNSHLPFLNMVCLHLPTLYTYHGIAANTAVPILPPSYSFAHLAKPRGMPAIPTHGSTTVEAEAHFCSYQLDSTLHNRYCQFYARQGSRLARWDPDMP